MGDAQSEESIFSLDLSELFSRTQASFWALQQDERSTSEESFQHDVTVAVKSLLECRRKIKSQCIFSSNEQVDDINTEDLNYILTEYFLGMLQLKVVTDDRSQRPDVLKAGGNWLTMFRSNCEDFEILSTEEHDSACRKEEGGMDPGARRMWKIGLAKQEQDLQDQLEINIELQKTTAGAGRQVDEDVKREHAMLLLKKAVLSSQSEQTMIGQELEMLQMMASMGRLNDGPVDKRMVRPGQAGDGSGASGAGERKPMNVTHVGADMTIRREEIKAQVFQPGWNQPTMSLAEFADNEVKEAMEREERNKNAKGPDKKYAQLEEEGLEDDEELVDKATIRDRNWNDWCDDNPKGIGNKAGKIF
jgi:hypothetical protein